MFINQTNIQIGMLCSTHAPTSSPTESPTFNPTHDPTQSPTIIPTIEPTAYPTPDPVNMRSTDKFVIFTYQNWASQFEQAITFPFRPYGEFMNVYTDRCQLQLNGSIDFRND
eukprot:341861_1